MGIVGALLALPVAAAVMMLIEELRVELPGEQEQGVDVRVREADDRGEEEYERRAEGVGAEEAAAIAVEISRTAGSERRLPEGLEPALASSLPQTAERVTAEPVRLSFRAPGHRRPALKDHVARLLLRGSGNSRMFHRQLAFLASAALLAVAAACSQSPGTVERSPNRRPRPPREPSRRPPKRSRSARRSRRRARRRPTRPPAPSPRRPRRSWGRSPSSPPEEDQSHAGEKKMHGFDLDEKDLVTAVEGGVVVGTRVTLTDETGIDKVRRITVRKSA